ncbi:hypothetical protein DFH07DRAFT_952058 [Mycena maculata]|uniref:Uncharacterized protein n=1 Tax=Mycena maculata TaxID=230809 RepID=A0AAD7K0I7_9AGAR|nr:hypothetical protein DFH07DRAFT_952058 [Mycena maculata]
MTTNARTHPCLRGDPLPASATQPDLTVEKRYFVQESDMQDYLYDIQPVGKSGPLDSYHIPFHQISGVGPPPPDLTGSNPGDVYVDATPGQHALYGQIADGRWKRWLDPGPQPWDKAAANGVRHPHFRTRRLWCSTAKGVSWFTASTVRKNQERARAQRLVAPGVHKDEAARFREAAVLISASLAAGVLQQQPKAASASHARRRRSSSHCSPPFEPSPVPVLGKRKMGVSTRRIASKCDGALIGDTICYLKEENADLAAKISTLETRLALSLFEEESQEFSQWAEGVIRDGLETQTLAFKNQLGVNGRKYLDLVAELAAVETQLAQEEARCEDAQIALNLAVSEDEECMRQFDLATSQLGSTFGWA